MDGGFKPYGTGTYPERNENEVGMLRRAKTFQSKTGESKSISIRKHVPNGFPWALVACPGSGRREREPGLADMQRIMSGDMQVRPICVTLIT